jgi:hypothetical protein
MIGQAPVELTNEGDAMNEMRLVGLEDMAETTTLPRQSTREVDLMIRFWPGMTEVGGVLMACGLLLTLSLALFHRALSFVPENGDDLRLLSSVIHTTQPLKPLVGDWGAAPYQTGNYGEYRPLHPISLWIVYKLLGLRTFPNQFINFALHYTNVVLLLLFIWRMQKDLILAFMGAASLLVSVHTMSPAIWVSDRASLQVGLALLLLMHHIVRVRETGGKLQNGYVLLLCLLALLSKESGLIVPLLAIVVSVQFAGPTIWERIRSAAIWAGVVGAYLLARYEMFGANAASYSTFGYLFGVRWYDLGTALPPYLQKLAIVDNVVKNIVELFLPLFNNEGGFNTHSTAMVVAVAFGVLGMASLLALSIKGKLTPLQKSCLWIIVLNAAIHSTIFRYRVLYTAQIAICIFFACAPALTDMRRKRAAIAAVFVLLIINTVRVDNYVQQEYLVRYNDLNRDKLAIVLHTFAGKQVDPELARQLVQKYRDPNY